MLQAKARQPVGAPSSSLRPMSDRTMRPGTKPVGPLDEPFARLLQLTKAELLDLGATDEVHQTGGALLGGPVEIPDASPLFPDLTAPLIETFLVEGDGTCTPTGTDQALIDATEAVAATVATRTLEALGRFEVPAEVPGYLTASVSPIDQVANTPHIDDDQFVPAAGVGAFAIVGDGMGPRLAVDPIPHLPVRPGLPLQFEPEAEAQFDDGTLRAQQVEACQLVMLPQFGQLHAGPNIAGPANALVDQASSVQARSVRTLFVFRLTTCPPR